MINIDEYLRNFTPDQIGRNKYFYEHLLEYYDGNNIPNKYIKLYEECRLNSFDYINENLQTHDYKKLQSQLLKEYDDYIENFKDYEGNESIKSFYIILKNQIDNPLLSVKNVSKNIKEVEKFFNILRFFNYQYSNWKFIDDKYVLYIEPIYSEDASEYFNKCHRQAYHFTYKKNVKGILENGLRLKRGTYRKFPERIYLWATDKKQDINDENKELLDFARKIFGDDKLLLKDIGIIKVDLYHTNFPVYKDTAMKEKEALFIYNSIPAKLCKEVTQE